METQGLLSSLDENISNFRFVAFDTETTGSSTTNDQLVEVAAMSFDEDFEHRRFETYVKPPRAIPHEVIRIHGITDEMVAGAPNAVEALEKFFGFLSYAGTPRILVAHNAGFDIGMINSEWKRAKAEADAGSDQRRLLKDLGAAPELVLDSCMLAKALLPELPQHRLESLANHFKITTGRMHRAMEDVRVLQLVFMKLLTRAADRVATGSGLTLNALIDLAGGYFVLSPADTEARNRPFRLPPRISALEPLCGSEARVSITYETESDCRYITPLAVRMRGFKVYVEAFCHRDNIKKTFRADKILSIGRIEAPASC